MRNPVIQILATVGLAVACTAPLSTSTPTPTASVASPTVRTASPNVRTESPTATAAPALGPLLILAVQRLDSRTGWVSALSGGMPVLLRTQDGGSSWERLTLAQGVPLAQLAFTDAQTGWAIARTPFAIGSSPASCRAAPDTCESMVLTTTDGGRTWIPRVTVNDDPDRGPAIIDLGAADGQRAWVTVRTALCDPAGCAHEIRGTEDGGATWEVLRRPQQVTGVERTSTAKGWVLGPFAVRRGGEILGTSDAGIAWAAQFQSELSPSVLAARSDRAAWALFFDPAYCTASACTTYDLVRTTDGATWSSLGNPARDGCGGHLSQMAFGDAQTGWITVNLGAGGIVGTGGVLRTSDGGATWTCRTNPPNTVLVTAANAQQVWVTSRDRGSSADTLWASDDGGRTWRHVQVTVP